MYIHVLSCVVMILNKLYFTLILTANAYICFEYVYTYGDC